MPTFTILNPRFDDDLFTLPLAELLSPFLDNQNRPRIRTNRPTERSRLRSKSSNDNTKFNLNFDMSQYAPSEISVKYDNGQLMINAKHEKSDGGHYEYREFREKCVIPENVISEQLKSSLDNDGILRIEAPYRVDPKERNIPVEFVARAAS